MTQGARPDVADVQTYIASLWALETTHKPIRFGERDSLESLHDLGGRMLEVLCAEVPDATKIMAVESAFTVPLVDQATGVVLDRDLVGTLDLVERNAEGHLVVVDLKTAARKYSDLQVEGSLQLSIYSYATAMNGLADEDAGRDPFAAEAPRFASTVVASLQGRVALGPRAGQPVRRLRSAATATSTGRRSARFEGFSLHADVAVPARRRDQLEKVCRYILRSPLAVERLTESTGGSSCISSAGPGATAPRRCSSIPWSCWGAWRPSCRRRADRCWPTMGSSARGRAGDRPSCRRHRRPTHGETWTRAPRGAGPGLGYSSGCSALLCRCAIAAGAGGGSSAR